MNISHKLLLLVVAAGPVGLGGLWCAEAGEMRKAKPIPYPQVRKSGTLRSVGLPPGALPVSRVQPVDARTVGKAMQSVAKAWNMPGLGDKLDPNFVNKDRLADAIRTQVPRDGTLRILGIQGFRTLDQRIEKDAGGSGEWQVSRISVMARTQIELRYPRQGFRRGDGTNEYIIQVREKLGTERRGEP